MFKKETKKRFLVKCRLDSLTADRSAIDPSDLQKDIKVEFVRGKNEKFITKQSYRFSSSQHE